MKWLNFLALFILLSSCGKKSDGSDTGDSPLFPAPAIAITQPEKVPFPDLEPHGLRIEPPVIICFNNQVFNQEKREELEELLDLIHEKKVLLSHPEESLIGLLKEAIATLAKMPPESRRCPVIFLAIDETL